MKQLIRKVIGRQNLTRDEAAYAMTQIMEGEATPSQIAALAVALRMKGETADELTGFAKVMRDFAIHVPVTTSKVVIDTCGTGGDSLKTFNVSTSAAIVVAATAKVAVAKHGNRAATSKCGSADVLEALGVRLELAPNLIGRCIDEIGIGFLYARQMHPALKYAAVPRQEIGTASFFNILGPLTNPASATVQLIGVNDASLCDMLAQVLRNLGSDRAIMVHGVHGLDELSTLGDTLVSELVRGEIRSYTLNAQRDLGIPEATIDSLAAGETASENALILRGVIEGRDKGPRQDIVALNAAGVLLAAGITDDLRMGVDMATETIESGAASRTLNLLIEFTNDAHATAL
ncbi:MAG: anthranilate phosphoribosyltransferase [Capsulimonadaceae bacterium]|nr:anthranilate phosphoribosyltransferase [Capsulimonadaceae bacterium]